MLSEAAPGVEFDIVGISPPDRHLHALTEVRCGIAALRNALYAERAGYDAIVIGHFQEPLLHELRACVRLPVIGFGEASLAAAHGRLGLVAIDEVFVPWHLEQVRRHGIEDRVVGVCSLETPPDGFMAAMTPGAGRARLLMRLEEAAAPLVAAGAETIVPAGALTPAALCGDGEIAVAGVPVLNGVAVTARAAAEARPRDDVSPPPAAAVEEFLAATGGELAEPVS
jgi:allantoin racemase